MPAPETEVAEIVHHFLALVREHGVAAELDGELSMLLTAKLFLIIHNLEPEKNLRMYHRSREVFSAVWTSPDDFEFSISRPDIWEEAAAEMLAKAARGMAA